MTSYNSHRFETPENVQVTFATAGLGSRLLAWSVDQILVWLLTILVIIALVAAGISFDSVFNELKDNRAGQEQRILLYLGGIIALLWGFGSFLYFSCCELLLRGQTLGKRMLDIRVVKANGFQLDTVGIVMRNAFRVIDQLPPMWIIPFLSKRSQRAGDMVAGTLVISDAVSELSPVRAALVSRPVSEFKFRFDHSMLKRLSADDYVAIERFLERMPSLSDRERESLLSAFTTPVTSKLRVDMPAPAERLLFLEDLYSAELRRRDRALV